MDGSGKESDETLSILLMILLISMFIVLGWTLLCILLAVFVRFRSRQAENLKNASSIGSLITDGRIESKNYTTKRDADYELSAV